MQHTLTIPPLGATEPDSGPIFNVVIAYEDFESGKQAMKTYDFLAQNLGAECHLTNQMWKFDVLSIGKLREVAVKDAALADIIILACRGDVLPAYVKDWIESWVEQTGHPLALVALLGNSQTLGSIGAVHNYLASIAQQAGMEFFARAENRTSPSEGDRFPFQRRFNTDEHTLSMLAGSAHGRSTMPRWGINE